jgi:aryl-alcohol dehydrogenase-like predicted oxidoreductase
MEYVPLGQAGLRVSRICLGTMSYGSKSWRPWVLDEAEGAPFIARAWERGINFFDTADMYSRGASEEVLGRALKRIGHRDEIVVATKVFYPHGPGPNLGGLSRKHVLSAIDSSLRRLDLDYVDLYIIHRLDPATPIEETMEALHDVVRAGKARYLGASSMYAWQFAKAQHVAERNGWTRFVSMQNHYNLVYREEEREMLPLCRDQGVGVTPWSPLARGFLAGNRRVVSGGAKTGDTPRSVSDDFAHRLYYTPGDFEVARRVAEIAARRGATPVQVALAWLLQQPGVTAPIIGVTRLEQLDDTLGALGLTLDAEERSALEEPYVPHPVLGH